MSAERESNICNTSDVNVLESIHFTPRMLYGGAVSANIPSHWRDVSEIRQVPDHQEVFQDHTTMSVGTLHTQCTGCCIIFEILEREDVKDDEVADYFFRDLASANGSDNQDAVAQGDNYSIRYKREWTVGNDLKELKTKDSKDGNHFDLNLMPNLSIKSKAFTCIGFQSVFPLRKRSTLEEGKEDRIRVELCVLRLEHVQTDVVISLSCPVANDQTFDVGDQLHHHSDLFLDVLRSFQIIDWSLFGI